MKNTIKINTKDYYNNYYGHTIQHLNFVHKNLKKNNDNIIFLAGDSSLDNKYWLSKNEIYNAINGYENILYPSNMKPDISYHINTLINNSNTSCINCAVEASTIDLRIKDLLNQDKFIRDNISSNDTLIISLGGNDIALAPTNLTLLNMASLLYMNTCYIIKQGPDIAWGLKYFIHMFKDMVKEYIEKLISKNKPKKIIVCTIYYPDLKQTGGWADKALNYMGYNSNPEKLKEAINQIYIHATSEIKIEGIEIIPFPMFKILDGHNTDDYICRVEPSNLGGFKLAKALVELI